jgi:hypothetical protein
MAQAVGRLLNNGKFMNLLTSQSSEQRERVKSKRIISNFIANLTFLFIFFYLYKWYLEPTIPLSRLPYCARELLFKPLSEINGEDGKISGIFTTDFIDTHHFGDAYGVLKFHEDGSVASYNVNELRFQKIVRAHQLASWIKWYEKPSLSVDDIPIFAKPRGKSWDIYMDFFVEPPYKGTYFIQQGNLTIKWDEEQKWRDDPLDELWAGTLIGEQLNIVRFHTYGNFERAYYFLNYNTCPYNDL